MQNDGVTQRQIKFAVFLQSMASLLLITAGIVRWTAVGFDAWSLVFILAGIGAATAVAFLTRALRRF
ncbi:MAG TPA: hypothetical protein DDY88_04925 [Actinobacteria bacterium]|nr:hypothetical protein [Actinomycetota bacterium]